MIYKSIEEARKADIIHIHSLPEMVINIRKIYGGSKIIILHYHGTDIRGFSKDNSRTFNLGNILKPKNIVKKIKKMVGFRILEIFPKVNIHNCGSSSSNSY